jgi:uncharacterized protein (TIGR02246 family)
MRTKYVAGCAVALLFVLAGCSDTPAPPADTSAADQKAIKDGETQWAADWGAKDVDKIASHYADNATLLVPDAPAVKGKDAIKSALQSYITDDHLSMNFTTGTVATSKSGDLGYTQGTYTMTMTNPKTKKVETEIGKYVTVYQKQADGSWKAVEDINNADAPAATETPAKKHVAAAARKRKK